MTSLNLSLTNLSELSNFILLQEDASNAVEQNPLYHQTPVDVKLEAIESLNENGKICSREDEESGTNCVNFDPNFTFLYEEPEVDSPDKPYSCNYCNKNSDSRRN